MYVSEQGDRAVAGTYKSVHRLKQDPDGLVTDFDAVEGFQDHRQEEQPRSGPCEGGWLYSGNMGVVLAAALAVNGYDEEYSGQGSCGDCDFGIRVERAGWPGWWNPFSMTYQVMTTHTPILAHRGNCDPYGANAEQPPQKTRTAFGHEQRANVWLLDKLSQERHRTLPVGNHFSLTELRRIAQNNELLPVPKEPITDWRDGQLLCDM